MISPRRAPLWSRRERGDAYPARRSGTPSSSLEGTPRRFRIARLVPRDPPRFRSEPCRDVPRSRAPDDEDHIRRLRSLPCFFPSRFVGAQLCFTLLEPRTDRRSPPPPHRQRQQGRPKDGPEDKFRLTPCGARLSELLSCSVSKVDDCVGDVVKDAVAGMDNGSVCLLENVRFYKEEEKNVKEFAEKLAAPYDL